MQGQQIPFFFLLAGPLVPILYYVSFSGLQNCESTSSYGRRLPTRSLGSSVAIFAPARGEWHDFCLPKV